MVCSPSAVSVGLDVVLVRLVRGLGSHQQPLPGLARVDASGAFPAAGEKACVVLAAEAEIALDLAVPVGQTRGVGELLTRRRRCRCQSGLPSGRCPFPRLIPSCPGCVRLHAHCSSSVLLRLGRRDIPSPETQLGRISHRWPVIVGRRSWTLATAVTVEEYRPLLVEGGGGWASRREPALPASGGREALGHRRGGPACRTGGGRRRAGR